MRSPCALETSTRTVDLNSIYFSFFLTAHHNALECKSGEETIRGGETARHGLEQMGAHRAAGWCGRTASCGS